MSDSQESMEVTLQTEVESGASGFSVAGGGSEGIFVKQVLKESPASKLFSLKEGDQLLSATIFFDNIKYEDALKILQYSEPYKVQFNLKRKLIGKEDLETMHSATQSKKEKLSQGKEALEISEKTTSEDKANLIVKQRVGRPKRTKKDRLSWPKFQSMKGKKILGHRRSRSTSDAYEHTIPDVSPTSTDTESQFQQEELHTKVKKGSQKKLKFPSIGFKMHRSKQETEDTTKYEVKPLTEFENDTTGEIPELITVEDSTTWNKGRGKEEKEKHKKRMIETKPELPYHTKTYPEVELTIKKPRDKKMKSEKIIPQPETGIITSQIMSAIQINDMNEKEAKLTSQLPKARKKKHKGSKEKIQMEIEGGKEKEKPEIKEQITEKIKEDSNVITTAPDMRVTISQATLALKDAYPQVNQPSDQVTLDGTVDGKFKMPKLHMPKFGAALPKGKAAVEGEITSPSMEVEVPKPELKAEVTLPSVGVEGDIKLPKTEIEAPSLEMEVGEKGKFKMPDVKVPSVKMPKVKTPQVGISLPKVETDVSLPKAKVEIPEAEVSIKVPEAEGSIEGGRMKVHMPKFKIPSMGFSKPGVKGPEVDTELSLPEVDATLRSADLSITKSKLKTGDLQSDINLSAPDMKLPSGQASLELKAPDVQLEAPSAQVALDEAETKVEGVESKFKMPKFHMPKFGVSLPKGKAAAEGEITVPSMDVQVPMPKLKAEVTLPAIEVEGDFNLPKAEIEAPSLDVEMGEKGKFKMPDVKMPSVKMPKVKTPEVGVSLPKVETDVTPPKGKVEMPEAEVSGKVPNAETSIEGGGMKVHMPKFKMPSMGFSKPDIKGPKVDVDFSLPEVDATLPSADISITKPELKTGDFQADISLSPPDVKLPSGQASLELEAPDLQVEAPSVQVALDRAEIKVGGVDSKFKMPKFHMPKFGVSLPKGKAAAEGEITLPSMDVEVPKPELKAEVTLPSIGVEGDIRLPKAKIEVPSLEVEVEEKGKFKMPDVKMPSVKMPKVKTPQVAVSLPNLPEVDATLPSADLSITKPELKTGDLQADISLAVPDVKLPSGQVSLELKAPDLQVEAPSAQVALDGADIKAEGADSKFKMPQFHMPKFEVSLPKGIATAEGEISLPSMDVEVPKPELKAKVTLPSARVEGDIKLTKAEIEAPSLEVEVGEEEKFKMPDVKLPRVKMPKVKTPQVGVSLPKVETYITPPKDKVKIPETEVSIKGPKEEGSVKGGGMKVHMPKFKMPSMGFSKPDVKDPKVDVDLSLAEVDATLPSADFNVTKPELKIGDLQADVSLAAPDVKIPSGQASLELKAPHLEVEAPSAQVALDGANIKVEGVDSKFKMPEVHMPKFGVSLPRGKAAVEGEITLPSMDVEVPKPELKAEVTMPSVEFEGDIELPSAEIEAPSLEVEVGEKKKFKMPDVKMPSVKIMGFSKPDVKGPKVDVDLGLAEVDATLLSADLSITKPELKTTDVQADVSLAAPDVKLPSGQASLELKAPELQVEALSAQVALDGAEIKVQGVDSKFKMPKFHMPKFGVSLPKGKAAVEGEITLPSMDVEVPKPELKAEVTLPPVRVEGDIELPSVEIEAPSLEVEVGEKEKFKMPDSKMPSVKMPKVKTPQISVSLPKVETDVTLSKAKVEIPEAEVSIKVPEAEGSVEVGEMKIHMPKFMMPSMGFSKPDVKGPQVDMDLSLPEVVSTLPSADVSVTKPELITGDLQADVSLAAPKVKLPSGQASLELKTPDLQVEAPSVQVALDRAEIKAEGVDSKFKMPKFHMPKFGVSLPKGKATTEGEITLPSMDVEVPKPELKAEVTLPSVGVEGDDKLPKAEISDDSALNLTEYSSSSAKPSRKKSSIFKMPKFNISTFGKSSSYKTDTVTEETLNKPELSTSPPVIDGNVLSGTEVISPSLEFQFQSSDGGAHPSSQDSVPETSMDIPESQGHIGGVNISLPRFHLPNLGISKVEITPSKIDEGENLAEDDVILTKYHMISTESEVEFGDDVVMQVSSVKIPQMPRDDIRTSEIDGHPSVRESEVNIERSDLDSKGTKSETIEKDTVEKESKFKMPKFKLPSFSWSPKKEATVSADMSTNLEESSITISTHDTEPELTLSVEETEEQTVQQEAHMSVDKDSEKSKIRRPQFSMPKISLSKMKGHKAEASIPEMETDVTISMSEEEGEFSLQIPEKEITGGDVRKGIQMPKVKLTSLELSKPEIKAPKTDREASLTKSDAQLPALDIGLSEQELKRGDHSDDISKLTAEIKVPVFEGPEVKVEGTSTEIFVDRREIKSEAVDGKIKRSKFQMPKFGISFSKGKIPEAGSLPSESTDVPQLKTTTDIADIAVEAPICEAEYDDSGAEKTVLEGNIKYSQIPSADLKTAVDVKIPSGGFSVAQPETGTPYSDATETKLEKEMKTVSLDAEEKEGNFKMPKFKLPSFNWSPKKEATIKTNIKDSQEEPKLTIDTDAELKAVLSQDQDSHMDQDADSSTKKSQVKRPHFTMPKISLPRAKLPKSQDKVETDITAERDGASVQIPDIESSFTTRKEEETEISIKMPKGISKSEIKTSQIDAVITLPKTDIEVSTMDSSSEVKSSKTGLEGEIVVDTASVITEGKEGKISLPKLQMPKFGIAECPDSGIPSTEMEGEVPQQHVRKETDSQSEEAPTLEVKADASDAKVSAGTIKMPQTSRDETKASDTSVASPDEKDAKSQGELEAKSGEVQIEESQGWFKMPKFRMPSFGRSSSKGKKSDAEVEGSTGKAAIAEVGVEIAAPEVVTQSHHVDIDSCVGKDILEAKVIFPQEEDSGIAVQKEKKSDVGLLDEDSLLQLSGKAEHKITAAGTKSYADIVKHGAEVESLQTHEPTATVAVSQTSVPKVDIHITLPKCDIDRQHKTKLMAEASPMKITIDRTEGEMDTASAEGEVVVQSPDTIAKTEKTESQIKSPKTSIQEKESTFKMPRFGVPSFGWSTTKSTGSVADVMIDQKEPDVVPSEVKMDTSIIEEDFEIIDFPTEGFEKDVLTEDKVKVEGRDALSKTKTSKFKMPKFGHLRSKPKVSEVLVDQTKMEIEVSPVKTEDAILGIQECSAEMKIPKTDFTEESMATAEKQSEGSELSFHIHKLKMPKFISSTAEEQILPSEGTAVKKSADIMGALQPELRTTFLEEKSEGEDNIQKSKVRITTLSEPTIQRTHMESKFPSTKSSSAEATTHTQRPTEFSCGFPTEIIQTTDGKIQKSVAKITTLMEPDIQRTQLEIKLPPEDSFISSTPLHIQGQYTDGKEIKKVSKSEFSYGDEESFSTQIVRESEIPPSDIKTAAYGFSLLKVKIQESHVTVDTPVKLSSTEYMNETFEGKDHQPTGESSGQATQKSLTELKLSDNGQDSEFTAGISSATTLTKVKAFTVEVQSSNEFAESHHGEQSEGMSDSAIEVTEETKVSGTEAEPTDQKEKSDSKRSSGRFKFWFPSIGFSSSADDAASDSKPEVEKSFPETHPDDLPTSDSDSAQQTEKTGWFRFPKLGFSSPTKKSKETDKEEEQDPTGKKPQDDESPTEKSETFFDAQETLPPKETITEKEGEETSEAISCEPIVSSSARTELILLEKEKAASQSIPEEASK
ncbi:hypothetical protein JD844_020594 [Phrynosoma platyrhinos]|uniref:PDZ domain-containing protein n=1 Tax=Phrynosoma platyrhinos TaxID=52577 RepID=A0ABQ7SSF6_PHRPL|nr:hypothetical protein JD844_020594 [Phrynosoma platyrhinos]